jgi:septum formation protein
MKIILASASPRRRQLLTQIGIPHEVVASGADEYLPEPLHPCAMVETLALRKGAAVLSRADGPAIVIAADTVVYLDGRILEKPVDEEDAFAMLTSLRGRRHTVYTGVALFHTDGRMKSFVETAEVYFRALTDEAIRRYIATGEPMDKAGAYGVQERGAALVERVEGDFFTVVGLPLAKLCMALEEWGVDICTP